MSGRRIARKDVSCAKRPEIVLPETVLGPDCSHGGTECGSAWRVDQAAKLALGINASGDKCQWNLVGPVKYLVKF